MNRYPDKYVHCILLAHNDKEKLVDIVNKIYQDGFEDGTNVKEDE